MITLSLNLLNDNGTLCRSLEKELSEPRFLSQVSDLHSEYKSRFYLCGVDIMTLVVSHDNTVFHIEKFNKKWHFTIISEAQCIFRRCQWYADKKYLCNQLERALLETETEYNSDECTICLDLYGEKIYILSCLHKFHPDCIVEAIGRKSECPVCRAKIDIREYI